MACCAPSTDEAKKSHQIDKCLSNDRRRMKEEIKLLLLGPGESGKSTIFKQLKIIQDNGGFSTEELQSYRYIVYGNVVSQMKVLVAAAFKLNVSFDNEDNKRRAENLNKTLASDWSTDLAEDIRCLWKDKGIQLVYDRRDVDFHLNDSSEYFFQSIDRFTSATYIPTEQDVLRVRVRSTGIEEAQFKFEDMNFRMVDVGGQRSERRKWIHCFDDVTAVLFCISCSEYDQMLREDDTMNRMKESLVLFEEICNSHWFRDTTFIVFFNKTDLLKQKIERVDLSVCFPTYTGGKSFENASAFIKARFLEKNQGTRTVYSHFTCAINTENVEFVFKAVKETVLKKLLNGLLV